MTNSILIEGKLPAGKHCPFTKECPNGVDLTCNRDKNIQNDYSCGYARAFVMFNENLKKG